MSATETKSRKKTLVAQVKSSEDPALQLEHQGLSEEQAGTSYKD